MKALGLVVLDKKIFESFILKTFLLTPWPTCAANWNGLNNFDRGPPRDHSCEVWSNFHKWLKRRCRFKFSFVLRWAKKPNATSYLWVLIWPQTGSKLSLDTRLVNYYLPDVNNEGKYTCHVPEWPRNKLPNMVIADFTYKIWPKPISVVQIVNVL